MFLCVDDDVFAQFPSESLIRCMDDSKPVA